MGTRARPNTALGALHVVPWGPPALDCLDELVSAVQADDRLAPATVVVPSSHAGATVRRRLAGTGRRSGLVNVGFVSFPQLTERLAAAELAAIGGPPLTPPVRLAAIRASLRAHPGWFHGASASPSALETLGQTLAELSDLDEEALDRLATSDARAADVVALRRDVQRRCAGYVDDHSVVSAAVSAVRRGGRTVDEVGQVIIHLPRRLRPLDVDLAEALAERGRLTVVLGVEAGGLDGASNGAAAATERPSVDAIRSRLGTRLPVVEHDLDHDEGGDDDRGPGGPMAVDVRLARAPDPHEEVRHAVRAVVAAAAGGVPVDRMAVVARLGDPYFALVHEELTAAGIPHHGPTGLRLGQSVAGRALLGALELFEHDLPRAELFRWLRSAPLHGPDGESLRVDQLDRLARETGIPGGHETWCVRLDAERQRLDAKRVLRDERAAAAAAAASPPEEPPPGDGAPADDTPPRFDRLARDLENVDALRGLVDWLAEGAAIIADGDGWAARVSWATEFLATALGPPEHLLRAAATVDRDARDELDGAPAPSASPDGEREEAAYLRLLQVLASLAALDDVDADGDGMAFRAVLGVALDAPTPTAGRFGHGLFVGSVAEAVGADHDLVVVLGMAEGIYPPRGQDDPVLPDAVRADLGLAALPPRRPARADERRDHAAALAGSRAALLSFPRADTRAQRERYPSRWFLGELRRRWSRPDDEPVGIDDLDDLADAGVSWWTDVPSFVASVEQVARASRAVEPEDPGAPDADVALPTLVTVAERTAATVLAHRSVDDGRGVRVEVPDDRPALGRGATAVLERQAGHFGPYTGHVGPHPKLRFVDQRVGSATSLETWATCPFRYFLRQVLNVRALDERAEADEISPLDRGSYVHNVLERFVADGLPTDGDGAGGALGAADLERLRAIAADVGEEYRTRGQTGRPLLWRLRSRQLLRLLEQILKVDRHHRISQSVRPVAVELAFGDRDEEGEWTGVRPVVVDLSGERAVAFRGYVDRVDRSPDGDRLVVIDYKTGKNDKYRDVRPPKGAGDIVSRGQHLQLVLYAMAAESEYGRSPSVSAFFWFVEQATDPFIGGEIDGWARARLVEVLEVIVGGIEQGRFPARPGDDDFLYGFENCGFCDFNRICPSARAEQWERVRLAPELESYRVLSEGPLVTPEPEDAS